MIDMNRIHLRIGWSSLFLEWGPVYTSLRYYGVRSTNDYEVNWLGKFDSGGPYNLCKDEWVLMYGELSCNFYLSRK